MMSSTNPSPTTGDTTDNGIDHEYSLLPQHVYLGRDTEGYVHHLDRDQNVVHRFEGGTRERVTPLGDAHLDDYLAFVADDLGWHERKQAATWDFFGR